MMRRLFLTLTLICGLASPAFAAWAEVQTFIETSTGGTGTTHTLAYGSNVTAGNLLVCFTRMSDPGADFTSVTSDAGADSWTQVTDSDQVGNGFQTAMYYYVADESEALTVTTTYSAVIGGRALACAEYSGLDAAPFDTSNGNAQTNPGTGADAVSTGATASTARDNSLAVACTAMQTANITEGSGFTEQIEDATWPSSQLQCQDKNITPTGAVTSTWTIDSATADPTSVVAVFSEPAGGAPATAPRGLLLGVGP